MTTYVSKLLEKMGWETYPTGPLQYEWLKVENQRVVAREGDSTWKRDINRAFLQQGEKPRLRKTKI